MLKRSVSLTNAFAFTKKYVVEQVKDISSGVVFLGQPKTGQFYGIFVYNSLEGKLNYYI